MSVKENYKTELFARYMYASYVKGFDFKDTLVHVWMQVGKYVNIDTQ
jgi:hypothetical protein